MKDDKSTCDFAIFFIFYSSNLNIFDLWHINQEFFQFTRINIFSTTNNHILDTACNAIVSVFALYTKVSRVQKSVFINDFSCGFWHFVISFHDVITTTAHFTLYPNWTFFVCFRIQNFYFDIWKFITNSCCSYFWTLVPTALCHTWTCFCQTVYRCDFFHIHFVHNGFHQLYRTTCPCHNSSTK